MRHTTGMAGKIQNRAEAVGSLATSGLSQQRRHRRCLCRADLDADEAVRYYLGGSERDLAVDDQTVITAVERRNRIEVAHFWRQTGDFTRRDVGWVADQDIEPRSDPVKTATHNKFGPVANIVGACVRACHDERRITDVGANPGGCG